MKNSFLILISFVALFLIQGLLLVSFFFIIKTKPTSDWSIVIINISFILNIPLTLFLFKKKINTKLTYPNIKIVLYIIMMALFFIVLYPFMAILRFSTNMTENIIEYIDYSSIVLNNHSILYFFSTIISIPILEELYYRKILLVQIKKKYNSTLAILISSLFFSIFHLDYIQCQTAFIFGLVSGYLYLRTKNIIISIILHSTVNFFLLFASYSTITFSKGYLLLPIYIIISFFTFFLMQKIIKLNKVKINT